MATNTSEPATPIGGSGAPQPPTTEQAAPIGGGGAPQPPTTNPAVPIGGVSAAVPVITTQPQSQTGTEGMPLALTVIATGIGGLSYQWYKNGTAIAPGDPNVGGTMTNSLSLFALRLGQDNGNYFCRVTNSAGSTDSAIAIVTVVASGAVPPTIAVQPQSRTVNNGNSATFSCLANGSGPFTYQWQKEGIDITAATSNFLTINNCQPSDAGNYRCKVTTPFGSVTSDAATLTVTMQPTQKIYLGNAGTVDKANYTAAEIKALQQTFPQVNAVDRSFAQGTFEISAPASLQNEFRVIAFPAQFVDQTLHFSSAGATLPMTQKPDVTIDGLQYKIYQTTSRSAGDFTIQGQTAINVT